MPAALDPQLGRERLAILQDRARRGPLEAVDQAELLELVGAALAGWEGSRRELADLGGWQALGTKNVEALTRAALQGAEIEPHLRSLAASQERWSKAGVALTDWRVLSLILLILGGVIGVFRFAPVVLDLPLVEPKEESNGGGS